SASRVEVAVAAPGLNETLSRAGSLTAAALAYSDRNVARETGVAPAAGWERFRELLLQRLVAYGVELRAGAIAEIGGVGGGGPAELGGNADATRSILLESGEMLHARALVLGFGDDPRSASAAYSPAELMPELAPMAWRTHAEIDILPVAGVPIGAVAVRTIDEWSLRIEVFEDRSVATVASPAGDRLVDLYESEYATMLETAGLVAAPGSSWRVRIGAAPFREVDERHRVHDALRVRLAEEAELVPSGRVLHGGDLAAAVSSAHEAAVHLRRHLLGLED
ncbi:MAG: hypothetical protein J0H64_03875, partial [Actinobacteria bacterium]|nr:hypothetical protein [Actinomycetota bacterium]